MNRAHGRQPAATEDRGSFVATDPDTIPQQPLDRVRRDAWDVAVVGAGPAGTVAACHLARQGHRVVLLDRQPFPREKVCGDGLIQDTLGHLDRMGLLGRVRREAHRVRGVSAFSPSRIEVRAHGDLLLLKRERLDALLAQGAAAAGAVFCRAEVRDLRPQTDGGVALAAADHNSPLRSRIVLIATGARLGLARRVGGIRTPPPNAVAVRRYVRSTIHLDRGVCYYAPALVPGYAWLFPVGDGTFNAGCIEFRPLSGGSGRHLGRAFDRISRALPLAGDLMRRATHVGPLRYAMLRCASQGAPPLLAPGVLAAGEAVGTTLPLTGEGVGAAMTSAQIAAEAIHQALAADTLDPLETYPRRLATALRPRHLAYAAGQRCLSLPWLNDLVARRAGRGGPVRQLIDQMLAERPTGRAAALLRWAFTAVARLEAPPR
ncbi:MAG: geranylgeranyl reductase family protein [Planctomycetota bacterium]